MRDTKVPKKYPAGLSDAAVRESLYGRGFYDSWITPELIVAERKVMAARLRGTYAGVNKKLVPGVFD